MKGTEIAYAAREGSTEESGFMPGLKCTDGHAPPDWQNPATGAQRENSFTAIIDTQAHKAFCLPHTHNNTAAHPVPDPRSNYVSHSFPIP